MPPYCVSSICGSMCSSKSSDTLSFVPNSLIFLRVLASIHGYIMLHTHWKRRGALRITPENSLEVSSRSL